MSICARTSTWHDGEKGGEVSEVGRHESMKITMFAALPQEYRRIKKLIGPWQTTSLKPFKKFSCTYGDREILLVETGMGRDRIQEALHESIRSSPPDLIISFGFAGSICSGHRVGEVFLGENFIFLEQGTIQDAGRQIRLVASRRLENFCDVCRIGRADIITSDGPQYKARLNAFFSDASCLLDMESHAVALYAAERGFPFLCFRSVSDGLDHEIDFDLEAISDSEGQVRPAGVIAEALKKPRLVRSFYTSWKRSRVAARSLADALATLLSFPSSAISELLSGCFIERVDR
jgi:adenosylhomocysteine nucleosidase